MAPLQEVSSSLERHPTASWTRFLEKVDRQLGDSPLIDTVAAWFVEDLQLANPGCAVGFTVADLDHKFSTSPLKSQPARTLVDKALTLISRRAQGRARAQKKALMFEDRLCQELLDDSLIPYRPVLAPRAGLRHIEPTEELGGASHGFQLTETDEIRHLREENAKLKSHLESLQAQVVVKEAVQPEEPVALLQQKLRDALAENETLKGQQHSLHAEHVVVMIYDGSEINISVGRGETVLQLKQRIAEVVLVPLEEVGVASGMTILSEEDQLLEDYGIESGARLTLFLEHPQKPEADDDKAALDER